MPRPARRRGPGGRATRVRRRPRRSGRTSRRRATQPSGSACRRGGRPASTTTRVGCRPATTRAGRRSSRMGSPSSAIVPSRRATEPSAAASQISVPAVPRRGTRSSVHRGRRSATRCPASSGCDGARAVGVGRPQVRARTNAVSHRIPAPQPRRLLDPRDRVERRGGRSAATLQPVRRAEGSLDRQPAEPGRERGHRYEHGRTPTTGAGCRTRTCRRRTLGKRRRSRRSPSRSSTSSRGAARPGSAPGVTIASTATPTRMLPTSATGDPDDVDVAPGWGARVT